MNKSVTQTEHLIYHPKQFRYMQNVTSCNSATQKLLKIYIFKADQKG